jgi:hypothetical protein
MRLLTVHVLEVYVRINQELEYVIQEQSMFEDSALEDACAYALMVNKGSERFKLKERDDDTVRSNRT